MLEVLPAFFVVSAVVIVTPGQDTALTIRNALAGGRRGGVFTAAGVSAGQAVWAVAASAGVAAIVAASEPVFRALKLAGAAYLVYLGLHALRDAWHGHHGRAAPAPAPITSRVAFRQGVVSNLANPKMAVFFTSLLPQFTGPTGSLAALLGLGLVFCTMTFVWLSAYAAAVARVGEILGRAGIRRLADAVTGAVLLALGLRLAFERR